MTDRRSLLLDCRLLLKILVHMSFKYFIVHFPCTYRKWTVAVAIILTGCINRNVLFVDIDPMASIRLRPTRKKTNHSVFRCCVRWLLCMCSNLIFFWWWTHIVCTLYTRLNKIFTNKIQISNIETNEWNLFIVLIREQSSNKQLVKKKFFRLFQFSRMPAAHYLNSVYSFPLCS